MLRFFGLISLAAVLLLSACNFPSTSLSSRAKSDKAILVYGLDASGGPVTVALAPLQPQSCSGQAEAQTAKGQRGVTYHAFEVPPGTYAISAFNTLGVLDFDQAAAFVVPAGQRVFVGTFRMSGPGALSLDRDLDAARRALSGAVLLAEPATTDIRMSASAMCQL